jgi:hypothetical protein
VSDGVPLKQVLEPGEYRVEWELPTQEGGVVTLHGDVRLHADRPPDGRAYGDVPILWFTQDESRYADFPQVYERGLVFGQLLNGQQIALVGAVVEIWSHERAILHARAALVSRRETKFDSLDIIGLRIQVEGLDAIAGIGPIRRVDSPAGRTEDRRYLDWSWEAVGQPKSTQSWVDTAAEIELRFFCASTAPEAFFFRITFSPVVLVKLVEPIDLDIALSHWVEPLRAIVALSTGRKERITYLSLDLRNENAELEEFQVYGSGLRQEPYSSRGNDILKVHRAFLVSPNQQSLLAMLRQWQALFMAHHPLLETYASLMFAPDQHPRSRFLLLVQAIEGLHGYETRESFEERERRHGEYRNALIEEVSNVLDAGSIRFLRQYLMKRPPSGLDTAIRGVLGGLPVDIRPALEKTGLVRKMMVDERRPGNIEACLRLVRNDLAHGNRGYDAHDLHEVVVLLDRVVRAHLLRILGCPIEVQRRSQEQER